MITPNDDKLTKEIVYTLFNRWIRQRPGLDINNYVSGWNDKNGWSAYRSEVRSISKDRRRALAALEDFESLPFDLEVLEYALSAYSGRLQLKSDESGRGFYINYCTGQYWPTEYRQAAASVLELYKWKMHRIIEARWESEGYYKPAPNKGYVKRED